MEKFKKWLNPIAFCLFLFLTAAFLFFWPDGEYSEKEKRYLSQKPRLSWDALLDGSYQAQLESWTADQLPGRDLYVGVHAYWNLLTGQNALQDIYFASDDYLIRAPEALNLDTFTKTLTRFERFAAAAGLPASMIMVPSTGWLQEDRLPDGHLPYHDDLLFQEAESLLEHVQLFDCREALIQADSEQPVCYRTDHHLTAWGNYAIYTAWRQQQGGAFLTEDAYTVEEIPGFRGTTWSGSGYWLTPAESVSIWDSGAQVQVTITDGGEAPVTSDSLFFRSHLQELDMYPVYLDGNHCEVEIVNPDAPERTLLIIKDSYAHCFATYLTEHYKTIYVLDLRYYRGSVTDYIAEKNIDELLYYYGVDTLLTDTNSAWLF